MVTTATTPATPAPAPTPEGAISADQFRLAATRIQDEVGKVIVGQRGLIHQVLVTLATRCWKACRGWARRCWSAPWPR